MGRVSAIDRSVWWWVCDGFVVGPWRVHGQSGDSVASVQRTVVALPLFTLEGGPLRILSCTVLDARELRCELRRQSHTTCLAELDGWQNQTLRLELTRPSVEARHGSMVRVCLPYAWLISKKNLKILIVF
eukprot:SAG31_NODE_2988_length_4814_cov_11.404030_1_plen_130_part_00